MFRWESSRLAFQVFDSNEIYLFQVVLLWNDLAESVDKVSNTEEKGDEGLFGTLESVYRVGSHHKKLHNPIYLYKTETTNFVVKWTVVWFKSPHGLCRFERDAPEALKTIYFAIFRSPKASNYLIFLDYKDYFASFNKIRELLAPFLLSQTIVKH